MSREHTLPPLKFKFEGVQVPPVARHPPGGFEPWSCFLLLFQSEAVDSLRFMKISSFFRKKMRAEVKRNPQSKENTLFAGPWIGEFGWELFCWQGYLRARRHEFDKVIIASRPSMVPLYADFCDEFIPYTPQGTGISGYKNDGHTDWPDISDQREYREYISGRFYIGHNRDCPSRSSREFLNQEYFKYGTPDSALAGDVVLHIRQTDKNHSERRNGWTIGTWQKFLRALRKTGSYKIICIGDPQSSGILEGCEDRRGLPMDQLFNLLAGSRMLAGPSSGPIHLGALCGCPHVVWSGDPLNRVKYEKFWNPFATPVKYIATTRDWRPPVDPVVRETLRMLELSA
jgi:hypothetical protein